jgi:uncharacterized Zn-finger protein
MAFVTAFFTAFFTRVSDATPLLELKWLWPGKFLVINRHQSPLCSCQMKITDLLNPQEKENQYQSTHLPSPASSIILDTPVKKFPCTEPGCTKSFTRRYNLSAHLRCHRSEKPFACTECPLKFARKHDLTRHIRSLHEHKRNYGPCPTCHAYFTRSDALARHLKVEEERLKN